jgi:hypothetical protein
MLSRSRHLQTLNDLCTYVNETLCHEFQLETNVFPIRQRILLRGTRPCGVLFCLYGPGSLVLTAVWETDTNAVLFYGPRGERFHRAQLALAPAFERPATAVKTRA